MKHFRFPSMMYIYRLGIANISFGDCKHIVWGLQTYRLSVVNIVFISLNNRRLIKKHHFDESRW